MWLELTPDEVQDLKAVRFFKKLKLLSKTDYLFVNVEGNGANILLELKELGIPAQAAQILGQVDLTKRASIIYQ